MLAAFGQLATKIVSRSPSVLRRAAAADSESDAGSVSATEPVAKGRASAKPRPYVPPFDPKQQIGITEPFGFFDPVGICPKDEILFNEYRACEIKHGRVAMMAAVGAVVQHYIRFPGFEKTNFGEPMPTGLGAVTSSPGSFGFVLLLVVAAVLELLIWKDGVDPETGMIVKEPGNFGDPLGLGQYTNDMRNREINNGRMAMFAAFGILAAEIVTSKDAVQQLGL